MRWLMASAVGSSARKLERLLRPTRPAATCANDEVALEVTDLGAKRCDLGSQSDEVERSERARLWRLARPGAPLRTGQSACVRITRSAILAAQWREQQSPMATKQTSAFCLAKSAKRRTGRCSRRCSQLAAGAPRPRAQRPRGCSIAMRPGAPTLLLARRSCSLRRARTKLSCSARCCAAVTASPWKRSAVGAGSRGGP